jgi:glucose-1-phosphate thymidylyltransferase
VAAFSLANSFCLPEAGVRDINFRSMNVLILAAGYATRLYPLTLNKAKPLLEVAGKPMIEWVLDNLAPIPDIEKVYVVTNARFAADFERWAADYQKRQPKLSLKIINDGSTSDSDKLGAIGDINLVVTRETLAASDLIVVAGDNLFSEPLDGFAAHAKKFPATIATYDVKDLDAIKKYNNIETNADGQVIHFEEKPAKPKSTITGIALYYFSPKAVGMFATYIAAGNNPDQPGRFIQWLYPHLPVQTYQIGGIWYDIGSKETLEEANKIFAEVAEKKV